jgi:hypothetical protein
MLFFFVQILAFNGIFGISRADGPHLIQLRNFSIRVMKTMGMGVSNSRLEHRVL